MTQVTPVVEELQSKPTLSARLSSSLKLTGRFKVRPSTLLALAFYVACVLYITWPLITQLKSAVLGIPGDPGGNVAQLRELVSHHLNPFVPGVMPDFNYPHG